MTQQTQPITYHSTLHRHIHSILPQSNPSSQSLHQIYSSNQQPPIPSILQKSRSKRSHQKSIKKGISRVSKSKSKIENQKIKGTLLNFNTQDVIQSKYHISKTKDQIIQRSNQKYQNSLKSSKYQLSNQKQILDEYRIVTYVPPLKVDQQKFAKQNYDHQSQNKQNNLNQSNINKNKKPFIHQHNKNQSQSIQVVNPSGDNILELNTWRTSSNYDQYYSNNYGTDCMNRNQMKNRFDNQFYQTQGGTGRVFNRQRFQREKGFSSINQQQSTFQINFQNNKSNNQSQHNQETQSNFRSKGLQNHFKSNVDSQSPEQIKKYKSKIKHLQHQIVQISRQKTGLERQNENIKTQNLKLKAQNNGLKQEVEKLSNQNQKLKNESKNRNYSSLSKQKLDQSTPKKSRKKLSIISPQLKKDISLQKFNNSLQQFHKEKSLQYSGTFQEQFKPSINQVSLSMIPCNSIDIAKIQEQFKQQIRQLELLNVKLSKQISQKTLQITQLIKKNKESHQKLSQKQRQLKKDEDKIESQQEKLYRKDQRINTLSLQIQRLENSVRDLKQDKNSNKNSNKNPQQLNTNKFQTNNLIKKMQSVQQSYSFGRIQKDNKVKGQQLSTIIQKYQQLLRQYNHLQKKYNFMKDQLDHVKYLQEKNSQGYFSQGESSLNLKSHRERFDNYASLNKNNFDEKITDVMTNNQRIVQELQFKLQATERHFNQTQFQYLNLKQNFRALQQLYIKQQDEIDQMQKELLKTNQQNSKLKIQLTNLQQISNARRVSARQALQSNSLKDKQMKILEKQETLARLNKDYASLQRKFQQIKAQVEIQKRQNEVLTMQKQSLNRKYLSQIENNQLLTNRQNQAQDLQIYITTLQSQHASKIYNLCFQYQTIIQKLKQQISIKVQDVVKLKGKHVQQIKKLQKQLQRQVESWIQEKKQLNQQIKILQNQKKALQSSLSIIKREQLVEKQNQLLRISRSVSKYNGNTYNSTTNNLYKSRRSLVNNSSSKRLNQNINFQLMSRKQLQNFASNLEDEINSIQSKNRTLLIENQSLSDSVQENNRLLSHLEKEIVYYKDQKENTIKQKLQLCQQAEKVNLLIIQIKKINLELQDQNKQLKNQVKLLQQQNNLYNSQSQSLLKQNNYNKQQLIINESLVQRLQKEIKLIKIQSLDQKDRVQKLINQLNLTKQDKQTHRSKEEYYKMLFEKTQKDLTTELQQKSKNIQTKEKQLQSLKRSRNVSTSHRQTELYRIQIYKSFNKLLNLSSQLYTFQAILQTNEQSYLKRLYQTVQQEIKKEQQLKKIVIDLQQKFKNQKVHIKQDYDVVYEKYLKYKSMCQSMQKDIEKFKLQLRKSDDKFMGILL